MTAIPTQHFPIFASMDKLASVQHLIQSRQIRTLADLYKRVSRKDVAELLQINAVSFTRRANDAGKFRLGEINTLSQKMNIPFEELLPIFVESL